MAVYFSTCLLLALLMLSCTSKDVVMPMPAPPVPIPVPNNPVSNFHYLALGDSYTIGQSVPESDRFPVQLTAMLRSLGYGAADPQIIATTGWTTGNLLDALQKKTDTSTYDLVSLLIGVNNQYQGRSLADYRVEFTALLKKSIQYARNNPHHVIVLSIPDYSVTPYASQLDRSVIASQIDAFNLANKEISAAYDVRWLDITPESRKASGDLSLLAADGLHYSGKEYKIWAEMMVPVVKAN